MEVEVVFMKLQGVFLSHVFHPVFFRVHVAKTGRWSPGLFTSSIDC